MKFFERLCFAFILPKTFFHNIDSHIASNTQPLWLPQTGTLISDHSRKCFLAVMVAPIWQCSIEPLLCIKSNEKRHSQIDSADSDTCCSCFGEHQGCRHRLASFIISSWCSFTCLVVFFKQFYRFCGFLICNISLLFTCQTISVLHVTVCRDKEHFIDPDLLHKCRSIQYCTITLKIFESKILWLSTDEKCTYFNWRPFNFCQIVALFTTVDYMNVRKATSNTKWVLSFLSALLIVILLWHSFKH